MVAGTVAQDVLHCTVLGIQMTKKDNYFAKSACGFAGLQPIMVGGAIFARNRPSSMMKSDASNQMLSLGLPPVQVIQGMFDTFKPGVLLQNHF